MTGLPRGYDEWRTEGPDEGRVEIGTEDGQPCNRYPEPDEDMPRGCRPKRCNGLMAMDKFDGLTWCDVCGEIA